VACNVLTEADTARQSNRDTESNREPGYWSLDRPRTVLTTHWHSSGLGQRDWNWIDSLALRDLETATETEKQIQRQQDNRTKRQDKETGQRERTEQKEALFNVDGHPSRDSHEDVSFGRASSIAKFSAMQKYQACQINKRFQKVICPDM
jgi:hypothetical protein